MPDEQIKLLHHPCSENIGRAKCMTIPQKYYFSKNSIFMHHHINTIFLKNSIYA
jgi:hypothetical protein